MAARSFGEQIEGWADREIQHIHRLIYQVATGIALDEEEDEGGGAAFIQLQGRRPASTNMEASRRKALAAKAETRGSRIVAVAHPGSAERLLSYRSGADFGSPVGWRKKKAAKAPAGSA